VLKNGLIWGTKMMLVDFERITAMLLSSFSTGQVGANVCIVLARKNCPKLLTRPFFYGNFAPKMTNNKRKQCKNFMQLSFPCSFPWCSWHRVGLPTTAA
jgi:hypothetical protein